MSDEGRLTVLRDMGLVAQVFTEQKLSGLQGDTAIGHTRYSTTGSTDWTNAQPIVQHGRARTVTLGHNGNLTNAAALRDELAADGIRLSTTSDTEVIAALIANDPAPLEDAIANTMSRLEGAYTVVALADGTLVGFRDPYGFRPLALGVIGGDYVLASETCALDLVGAELEREIAPGELVAIDERGLRSRQALPLANGGALCLFEFIYLARPDTTLGGIEVHAVRVRMGERLAAEAPVEADLVMPVPDWGTPAAIGFARATGIPFSEGLIKNRYVGRTFIQPDGGTARAGHQAQVQPARRGGREADGRRGRLDRARLHDAQDRRHALRGGCAGSARPRLLPADRVALLYGIDFADEEQLVASDRTVEAVREHIGATSLAYLSLDGAQEATTRPESEFCNACFTRRYPANGARSSCGSPSSASSLAVRSETF